MKPVFNFTNDPFIFLLCLSLLISCNSATENADSTTSSGNNLNYIEVVTTGMDFQLPEEIESGWTRFRYVNQSNETHFFIFEKMPDGLGLEDYKNDLIPPFMNAFKFFSEGDPEAGMQEFEKIPEWFSRVELGGGVGLTSPRSTSEAIIHLEPGVYVMECYVRAPDGMAHTFMGMIEELRVSETNNGQAEPDADLEIKLSSEQGVSFPDSVRAGDYLLSVYFEDQNKYETMLGHDINLVKLESLDLLDTLAHWVNAGDITSFRTPAPEGLNFLGGVEDLPAGATGYFGASLRPGEYVLISEIPNALDRGMYKTFSVY